MWLEQCQRRLRVASTASAVLFGAAMAASLGILLLALGVPRTSVRPAAFGAFVVASLTAAMYWWRGWTLRRVASVVEVRLRRFENLLVTSEEIISGRRKPPHQVIGGELFAAVATRLRGEHPSTVQAVRARVLLAGGAIISLAALLATLPAMQRTDAARRTGEARAVAATPIASSDLRVVITPPPYTAQPRIESLNPTAITVLEGSHVRLESSRAWSQVRLVEPDLRTTSFQRAGDRWSHQFTASLASVSHSAPRNCRPLCRSLATASSGTRRPPARANSIACTRSDIR